MNNSENIINKIEKLVFNFCNDHPQFDYEQVIRVKNTAKKIAIEEGADLDKVLLISNLQGIANPIFYKKDKKRGVKQANAFLKLSGANNELIQEILIILEKMFFRGSGVDSQLLTIEAQVVQDAERIDCLGALGIMKMFYIGGMSSKSVYNKNDKIKKHITEEAFFNSKTSLIKGLYENQYYFKDRMNTKAGKRIAEKRHLVMKNFEKQFLLEWSGKDIDSTVDIIHASSPWQDPYFLNFMNLMKNALSRPIQFDNLDFYAGYLTSDDKLKIKDKNKDKK